MLQVRKLLFRWAQFIKSICTKLRTKMWNLFFIFVRKYQISRTIYDNNIIFWVVFCSICYFVNILMNSLFLFTETEDWAWKKIYLYHCKTDSRFSTYPHKTSPTYKRKKSRGTKNHWAAFDSHLFHHLFGPLLQNKLINAKWIFKGSKWTPDQDSAINERLSQRTQLRNEGRNLSGQFPQSDQ